MTRTASAASPSRPIRFLRFALYGRAEAGKTCYLAALAMARISNPRKFSCDWLSSPDVCPRPPAANELALERWYATHPEEAPLARGKIWLDEAIHAMEQGVAPKPNVAGLVMRLRFAFRGPEWTPPDEPPRSNIVYRNYRIELIDYSGELVDDKLADTDLAKKLRDHLRDADGLIVLAEAPREGDRFAGNGSAQTLMGETLAKQSETLLRLRRAFEALRAAKWDAGDYCPVALVVNKGDRLLPADSYAPAAAGKRLEEFLNSTPEPPHHQLRDALRAAVGPGNFHAFVASAFGKSEARRTGEGAIAQDMPVKVNGMLTAFGLEDPMMWLARRREVLLMERLTALSGQTSWLKVWQLANGTHRHISENIKTARMLTRESPPAQTALNKIETKARLILLQQAGVAVASAVVILLGLALTLTAQIDRAHLAKFISMPAAAEFPASDADLATMREAKTWYASYQESSFPRAASHLFVLTRSSAGDRLAEIDERLQFEELGNLVRNSATDLAAVDERLAQIKASTRSDSGLRLIKKLEDLRAAQSQRIAVNASDASILDSYHKACNESNLIDAALVLVTNQPGISDGMRSAKEGLKKDFADHFVERAQGMIVKSGDNWAQALADVRKTTRDSAVKQLIGDARAGEFRDQLEKDVKSTWERSYYNRLKASPSREYAQAYMDNVPADARKFSVELQVKRYIQYIESRTTSRPHRMLIKSIDWGKSKTGYEAFINVTVNNQPAFGTDFMPSGTGQVPADTGGTPLLVPDGDVKVQVITRYDRKNFYTWSSKETTLPANTLRNPTPIALDQGEYPNDGQIVVLQITDLPPETFSLLDYDTLIGQ